MGILCALLAFIPHNVSADNAGANNTAIPAGQQVMTYEVYAGGLHAIQAQLTIDVSNPDRYAINLTAKTRGLLGKLAPWHGSFDTQGWIHSNGRYQPDIHQSTATWRNEVEVKEYNYNQDGSFASLTITEHDKPPQTDKPDDDLTDQTVDALTATLSVMEAVMQGQSCTGSSDVFDGKRRFAQVFHDKGTENLSQTKYNIYEGEATKCTVEVMPKGGKWYDKPRGWMSIQEQGREKGTMPTLWVAKLDPNQPAVPVKLLVKTDYGALFMHLTQYQSATQHLLSEKNAIVP